MSSLPKPQFHSADETSITLNWPNTSIQDRHALFLQYKEHPKPWEEANRIDIDVDAASATVDIVDLNPGTPYFVRLAEQNSDGTVVYGPETVFDTKPINCGPKKRCSIM